MNRSWKSFLLMTVASLALAGCATDQSEDTEQETTEPGETEVANVQVDAESGITEAVDQVEDSVVTVMNMQEVDLPLDEFGGVQNGQDPTEDELLQAGVGSGAVYRQEDDTAYIFTNNHVIEGSDAIEVMMLDGTRVEADVVGADAWTDLAVLEIDAEHVDSVAEFGDSENLTVGEPAIAIGSPLGTEFASSVTSGVVSGLNRTVPVDIDQDGQPDWEMPVIQTDAAINPGNSGGPLVNIAGQIIGINSLTIASGPVEGMGFAIPSNDAIEVINELETQGEIIRPVLGVTMVDAQLLSEQQRENLNLPEDVTTGVLIVDVVNGSSADNAGIQSEDVIVSFNGVDVTTGAELRQELYQTDVGEEVEIEFYRDGELQSTTATMTAGDQNL